MSDLEYLADVLARSFSCGVNLYLSGYDVSRLQQLLGSNNFFPALRAEKLYMVFQGRRVYQFNEYVHPSEIRPLLREAIKLEAAKIALHVAAILETT